MSRSAQLKGVRRALGRTVLQFVELLNEKITSPEAKIKNIEIYRNFEKVATVIPPAVWDAFERIKNEYSLNLALKPDPRRNHDILPIPVFPSPLSEGRLVKKLDDYQGAYLCYYDINERSTENGEPIIEVRRYVIDKYDERDGSLVGKFQARYRREIMAGLTCGSVKFVVAPEGPSAFYVLEQDRERSEVPPVSGILKADFSGFPYFYGLLTLLWQFSRFRKCCLRFAFPI